MFLGPWFLGHARWCLWGQQESGLDGGIRVLLGVRFLDLFEGQSDESNGLDH